MLPCQGVNWLAGARKGIHRHSNQLQAAIPSRQDGVGSATAKPTWVVVVLVLTVKVGSSPSREAFWNAPARRVVSSVGARTNACGAALIGTRNFSRLKGGCTERKGNQIVKLAKI